VHFGLLAYHPEGGRQFGGVGLMLRRPDVVIRVARDPALNDFEGSGRMADRAVAFARQFVEGAASERIAAHVPPVRIEVRRVPRPHTGLGSGTQLGMAVARAMAGMIERDDLGPDVLCRLVGRGQRSAVGVHGSMVGGLIVDGGKYDSSRLSPLVGRLPFPKKWRILLVRPRALNGLAGSAERRAFSELPPIDGQLTSRMCRLVLLGLLPAIVEQDVDQFGEALFELQQLAGECFKSAQGGVYADPFLARVVDHIRGCGVRGVGQSSWGPTLYAVCPTEPAARGLEADLREHFELDPDELLVTSADEHGTTLRRHSDQCDDGTPLQPKAATGQTTTGPHRYSN